MDNTLYITATYSGAKHMVHKHKKTPQLKSYQQKELHAATSPAQQRPIGSSPHVVNTCDLLWSIISIQSRKYISKMASNPKILNLDYPCRRPVFSHRISNNVQSSAESSFESSFNEKDSFITGAVELTSRLAPPPNCLSFPLIFPSNFKGRERALK